MPFWPFLMGAAALLTVWGIRRGAWIAPALALTGYILVRAAVWLLGDGGVLHGFLESTFGVDGNKHVLGITVCALWLFCTRIMLYSRAYVPGFFYTLSAITYPVFSAFGVSIGPLSPVNIVAECFAVLALGSIAGGLAGLNYSDRHIHRHFHWLASFALGMAPRQSSVAQDRGKVTSG